MLLSLEGVVESSQRSLGSLSSSAGVEEGKEGKEGKDGVLQGGSEMRRTIVLGRIFHRLVLLLRRDRVVGMGERRRRQRRYGDDAVGGGDRIERLLNLMDYLWIVWGVARGGGGGEEEEDGKVEFFRSLWNMRGTPTNPDTNGNYEGERVIVSLLSCFKDWFWSSMHTTPTTTTTVGGDTSTRKVVLKLLEWTMCASLSLGQIGHCENEMLSPLAVVILCSSDLRRVEGCYRDSLERCFRYLVQFSYRQKQQQQQRKGRVQGGVMMEEEDGINGDNGGIVMDGGATLEQWYDRLVQSIAAILMTEGSHKPNDVKLSPVQVKGTTTEEVQTQSVRRRIALLSQTVRSILSGGRNILFLFNVLHLYPNNTSGNTTARKEHDDDALCFTTLQTLNLVLLSSNSSINSSSTSNLSQNFDTGPILSTLCSLAAKGEDVTSLLSSVTTAKGKEAIHHNNTNHHPMMAGEGEDVLMDIQDDDDDHSDDDDDDDIHSDIPMDSTTLRTSPDRATSVPSSLSLSQQQQRGGVGIRPTGLTTSRIKRRAIARRQDLQTIPKLDRMYQMKIGEARRDVLTSLVLQQQQQQQQQQQHDGDGDDLMECTIRSLERIATDVGGGGLMLRLGSVVFRRGIVVNREDGSDNSSPLGLARGAYVRVLSNVLQCCSGTKSKISATSPLLSKLSFNSNLLEELWSYAQEQLRRVSTIRLHARSSSRRYEDNNTKSAQIARAYTATLVFSDLFSHQLLALDDEEFLTLYTTAQTDAALKGSSPSSTIRAKDVIVALRDVLHDLYWIRPVTTSDIAVPSTCLPSTTRRVVTTSDYVFVEESTEDRCQRGRLLLSGTKLWNALYERWSRLYRTANFCDEDCWLFPRLVTRNRDEEGAMTRSAAAAAVDENHVDMDVDQDDDDDDDSITMDLGVTVPSSNTTPQATAVDEENDALASSFRDPKMARILTSIPQSLPFDRRLKLFNSIREADMAQSQDESEALRDMMRSMEQGDEGANFMGRERVQIRRDAIYEDSMEQLNRLGRHLRKKVQVTFINQHGTEESGIDGGGVFKEFLDDLIKDAFNPESDRDSSSHPLFTVSPIQTLRVNVGLRTTQEVLSHYEFLGRVLGKAVYESILVEPQFCLPFLNQLLGKQNALDDLKNLDPEYYRQLSAVRRMNEHDIHAMGLSFELTNRRSDGANETVELIPGGSNMLVTKQNAIRYVHLVAHRRLNIETAAQTHAFLRGFRDLIPAAWVRLFSPYELQKLISGDDSVKGFDVKGLKEVMHYGGGYHLSQPIMQWFWEVVEEMSPQRQRKLLKFMTSCSRQPLLGFRSLSPQPCVQQVRLPEEAFATQEEREGDVRLPTSSTCMNLLKLPNYRTKEILRQKLIYAVEAGAGFELS